MGSPLHATVKNTFLEIVTASSSGGHSKGLARSSSESDLSRSSGQEGSETAGYSSYNGYWLPTGLLSSHSASVSEQDSHSQQVLGERYTIDPGHTSGPVSSWARSLGESADLISAADLRAMGDGLVGPRSREARGPQEAQPSASSSRLNQQPSASSSRLNAPQTQQSACSSGPLDLLRRESPDCSRAGESTGVPSDLVKRYSENFDVPLEVLIELDERGVLKDIPVVDNGIITSVGSISHAEGSCNPCAYWFRGMCRHGIRCHHCHFVHQDQKPKRLRPSKNTRRRIRALEQTTGKITDKDSLCRLLAYGGKGGFDEKQEENSALGQRPTGGDDSSNEVDSEGAAS